MNMFMIKCNELNNHLCDLCEELIKMVLEKISDHVFVNLSNKIITDVKGIKEDLGQKATDSKLLVDFEAKLEAVKLSEKNRLMNEYTDMIEWLILLNKNPQHKLNEENNKPIIQAFTAIDGIVFFIEDTEKNLADQRIEIENKL